MTRKRLYVLTGAHQDTITRVLQSHYRKYPCDIYREVINELAPLDRQAAVERMADVLEQLDGADYMDIARAALDALLQENQA